MKSKLATYQTKRRFAETPEPRESPPSESSRLYVIQKHDASHLHYDFRLEHDGVLLSWAVPKEPSYDRKVKRLAVHVEDHPVSYGSFSGMIPKGNYGAGTVEIWDTGTWEPLEDVDSMLKEGVIKFKLFGSRLKGRWALIRLHDQEKNWLLIKEKDESEPGQPEPFHSIGNEWESFHPQLATLRDTVPSGKEWIHEVKYDGYRVTAWTSSDSVRLVTRGNQDWTHRFKPLAEVIKDSIPEGFLLDGEIVVFNSKGISDFGGLQRWLRDRKGSKPVYVMFDILHIQGKDISNQPLKQRKEALRVLFQGLGKEAQQWIRYSDHFEEKGEALFDIACKSGLEGIISKDGRSPYSQSRTSTWIKTKCIQEEEFVIGGYTKPGGERNGFGALLVGQKNELGKLQYCGKVGTGFDDKDLSSLLAEMKKHEVKAPPFTQFVEAPPKDIAAWVKPTMVCQIRFTERTETGMLRHPVFLGLREDKGVAEVTAEFPMKKLFVNITHPERILFPSVGITKAGLAQYYELVADRMMPYMDNRPISVVRCPEGPEKGCFFQKHIGPGMPDSLEISVVGEDQPLLAITSPSDLLSFVQFGAIEFHAWGSTFKAIEKPDVMIFDLDPGDGVPWKKVLEASEVVAEFLRSLDLVPFAKVSGGKGVHVVVPVKPGSLDWKEFKEFAHSVAKTLDNLVPGQFVTVASKAKRDEKIYIDYLRNGRGATAIVPYSVRSNDVASVSVPLSWEDLRKVESPKEFRVSNVAEWLKPESEDPWEDLFSSARNITKATLKKLAG